MDGSAHDHARTVDIQRIADALERIASALEKKPTFGPAVEIGTMNIDKAAMLKLLQTDAPDDGELRGGSESAEEKPCYCVTCNRHGMSKSNQCPHCNAELKGVNM